ncbi:MAG: ABC transporter permease [Firmicutes bacterium]|nr:ABC transporter permease [Bacillota bacterium]MDY5770580.1 ABC transporter permease [Anaerovoracaceae bacterium]
MKELKALIKRDTKLFFKDKGMFFTSLITPVILLVLYATFLANIYKDSFTGAIPAALPADDALIDGCVGGQLFSSLLAVCCVTVAFCSNMLMVQDKVNGSRNDLTITPVKSWTLAMGYYLSTLIATLLICYAAMGVCFIYIGIIGWYITAADVLFIMLDIFLLSLFGTALSSIINLFLSTQGQISAVGTVVSAGYGFICGAYMPISQFSEGLQKVLSFLPGTYGTSLLRNHALRGVFEEMGNEGFPAEVVEAIKDSIDCNLYFFDDKVEIGTMYVILGVTVVVLIGVYVVINGLKKER